MIQLDMVWQQDHPDFAPYPGYEGFIADLLARMDPRFRRCVRGPRASPAEGARTTGVPKSRTLF
jgi:hypothetical protein